MKAKTSSGGSGRGEHPTMTMKLPKKATTVPSKGVWKSGLHREAAVMPTAARSQQQPNRSAQVAHTSLQDVHTHHFKNTAISSCT